MPAAFAFVLWFLGGGGGESLAATGRHTVAVVGRFGTISTAQPDPPRPITQQRRVATQSRHRPRLAWQRWWWLWFRGGGGGETVVPDAGQHSAAVVVSELSWLELTRVTSSLSREDIGGVWCGEGGRFRLWCRGCGGGECSLRLVATRRWRW